MGREAPSRVGRFVGVGWGFHGLLISSRVFLALRWMMLEKVFGVGAMRSVPYLLAKPSKVGVDVERTPCSLCPPPSVGVGLAYRFFGLGRFFLAWSPSLYLGESQPIWAYAPRRSGRGP
jgi:hypothetical protein